MRLIGVCFVCVVETACVTTALVPDRGEEGEEDSGSSAEWDGEVRVCLTFAEEHDEIELLLASPCDNENYEDPVAVAYDTDRICSEICLDNPDDVLMLNAGLDGGEHWYDWAAYNDQSHFCAWQPISTTVDGEETPVDPLPWNEDHGSNPADGEGCDGWIYLGYTW